MAWLAKIRICLIVTLAVIIITLAVVFSILRAVLPHATGYLKEVDQALEAQLGLPVKISALDADMSWLRPQLKLVNVRVYNADGKSVLVKFDEITFALSYIDSIRFMSPMIGDISLNGADLSIERNQQGSWFLQGVKIAGSDSEQISDELINQINNSNYSLLNSTIKFHDEKHVFEDLNLQNVNIRVENLLGTHAIQASVDLSENYGKRLQMTAEVQGDLSAIESANSEIYLNAQQIHLKSFIDKFGLEKHLTATGIADAKVWLNLEGKTVKQLKSRLAFAQLDLQTPGQTKHWQADALSADVFWQVYSDAWRLDVKKFQLSRNGGQWAQPGNLLLRENAATGYQISASYIALRDISDLLSVISTKHYPEQLNALALHQLAGDIYNLNLSLPPEDKTTVAAKDMELSAILHGVDLVLPEQKIQLAGIDGSLEYKDKRAHMILTSDHAFVEIASLFRQPISLTRLHGTVDAYQDNQQWVIDADSLLLANDDVTTRSRIHAIWPGKGKVYLDMQTDFGAAQSDAIKKYYPAGVLSAKTVAWLDDSLSGGRVDPGSFVFKGDAKDFPFLENQGTMEVLFTARDLKLQFLPDWPALESVLAQVRFHNAGLEIEQASAKVYRGELRNASASIDNLESSPLKLQGDIVAPADDMRKYIWNSGLNSALGDAMRQVQISGDLNLDLKLIVPLSQKQGRVEALGALHFQQNVLELPVMHYQLSELTGDLLFTDQSLEARELTASFEGEPVTMTATTVTIPRTEALFRVRGRLPIQGLLKRFDWIPSDWLKGRSNWDTLVTVPLQTAGDFSVNLSSSLKGTVVSVSDQLKKPAAIVQPTQVSVDWKPDALRLTINSDDILHLVANRDADERWQLEVNAPWLKGEAAFVESLSADSQIDIDLDYANLSALAKTGAANSSQKGIDPSTVPSINFHANRLDWEKLNFTDTAFTGERHSHGMLLNDVRVHSRELSITGKGSWLTSWQQSQETNFKLQVRSGHLGDALTGLGYPGVVDRGELEASVNWQWMAEPYRFALDELGGAASFKLEKGAMLDVKPGASGRLLGLFNVLQLPQRLMLDFGDVYKDGFVFDRIRGDLAFAGGNMTTRNINIKAASATINIDGRVGLSAEDYDLKMEVRPNSTAATFTGGTLAGGPIVGVGLALLEKLLGVDKLAREKYTITGKWDKPVIDNTSDSDKPAKIGDFDE